MLPFEELVRIELRVIVGQIRSLNQSIRELEKTIAEEATKLEGHKNLNSIKGIGKITGAILLSVIGDVNDFPDEEVSRIAQIAHAALDQSKVAMITQQMNVGELLAAVLEFYKQRFDSSGIAIQSRYSSDGNIPVCADQLRRVFSNLLLNAVEAMPQGGKLHVRVSAGHEWGGEGRRGVRVTIADSGSGIGSSLLPQLFERPFTTKSGGHGMGLPMVKDVMRQHTGWLRVRSSTQPARHGTVFKLFLPAA